jgi:hypothetical protein
LTIVLREMSNDSKPIPSALDVRCRYAKADSANHSLKARIAAFLAGSTHGEDLLHALYDHVLDEPIPQSMRAILKK